ncbi:MAG: universal stress protein, partial [Aquabacterium sp.]|nr:universal stress protein [Aquabacterium sp.]
VLPQMPKIPLSDSLRYGAGITGALLVLALGKWIAARQKPAKASAMAETAGQQPVAHLQRVLLAVDGSDYSAHAVQHLLALRQELRAPEAMELHLVNVQRPISGNVASFVDSQSLNEYHHERSEAALASARAALDAAGVRYQVHESVGAPGLKIAELAQAQDCNLIVMGTRGLGTHTAALLGSVAQATVENASVPVLLVK